MRKLVVFGQGSFGEALMESAKTSSGLEPDKDTYVLDGSDIEHFRSCLSSICNTVFKKDSLLLLADAENSDIIREAYLVLEKKGMLEKMLMVAGANVPCLVAAMAMKDEIVGDAQLARVLKAQAQSGIALTGRTS